MRLWRPLALLVAALTLAACGSTAPSTEQSQPAEPGAQGVSITDSRGKQISLPAAATKVVTLEWQVTENVVALGVQPVGVADIKGYNAWDTAAPLTGDPVDVGIRTEPSLESVARAEPDLIIGIAGSVPDAAMTQMEKIAPVAVLVSADARDQLAAMRTQVTQIGTLLGKEDVATSTLNAFDAHVKEARATLDPVKSDRPYAFSYISAQGNQVTLRTHTDSSLPGAVAKELGLTNAWASGGDDVWGLGSADVESLTSLPADTHFLYWHSGGDEDAVKTILAKNKIWTSLELHDQGSVTPVADGIWLYGGPASMTQWVDNLVAAINAG